MGKIIEGNIDLRSLYLTELFDLSDVEVTGHFNCTWNHLTNLVGSPHTVIGNFHCGNNKLTSLKGGPHTIGNDRYFSNFNCSDNYLTNLVGSPHTIRGSFYCKNNPLQSLKGIPKTIGGHFWISKELKEKFSEKYILSLSNIKGGITYL
jgi:hypothetical protein